MIKMLRTATGVPGYYSSLFGAMAVVIPVIAVTVGGPTAATVRAAASPHGPFVVAATGFPFPHNGFTVATRRITSPHAADVLVAGGVTSPGTGLIPAGLLVFSPPATGTPAAGRVASRHGAPARTETLMSSPHAAPVLAANDFASPHSGFALAAVRSATSDVVSRKVAERPVDPHQGLTAADIRATPRHGAVRVAGRRGGSPRARRTSIASRSSSGSAVFRTASRRSRSNRLVATAEVEQAQRVQDDAVSKRRQPAVWTVRTRYDGLIESIALHHEVEPALVKAIVQAESAFDPDAISQDGARGLMQVLPETASRFAVENLSDPRQNLKAGVMYLKHLIGLFDGNITMAVAAYNAGPNKVLRYRGVPPYNETRDYLTKVMGLRTAYADQSQRS